MQLKADIVIQRPAAEVFDYISNFENNTAWQRGMKEARFTTDPPLAVGSQYEQTANFMGKPVVTRFEVTDFQPGRSITIESIESTFPIQVTRYVEPLSDTRTRVRAEINGQPGGAMRLLAPLTRRLAQRSISDDYRRLKEQLENVSGS